MRPLPRKLSELLQAAGLGAMGVGETDPLILGISIDSRTIAKGDLFCAIRGFEVDGERFVDQALANGARAILARSARPAGREPPAAWVQVEQTRRATALLSREIWGRPDEALKLVGLTGTNGKTTVAYLLEAIAAAAGLRTGRIGTIGHASGSAQYPAARTTPESPEFYRLLAEMREGSADLVAAEISSHALALQRVEGARFAAAAFLNLGRDHLDFHGDRESYFEAKAGLIERLDSDRHAVLPADTELLEQLAQRCRAGIISFGRRAGAGVRVCDEHHGLEGSTAVLQIPSGTLPVRTHLIGGFNMLNVAAAAACALALDLPAEAITAGVPALRAVPGRMERIVQGQPFTLLVDFAHTAEALEHLLGALRQLAGNRLLVLFGCGGNRDKGKRFEMGRVAAALADRVVLTSDNPRDEDPELILQEIETGVASIEGGRERCVKIPDRREAIESLLNTATAGDVVVLAGKGHETTLVRAGQTEPFDDRSVARELLAAIGWHRGVHAET